MARLQHFGWFLSRGFGPHGWGREYLEWDYDWTDPRLYQQSARTLEQAGLDLVIIEDALSLGNPSTLDLRIRGAYGGPKHDPVALAPYLLDATERLGVAPTVNVLSWPPYLAARHFQTQQHLSKGRAGINVVTDVGSSRHFGLEPLGHDAAYDRADEWLRGLRELWGSWGPGALVADSSTGVYADASRLDAVRHRGEFFDFDGPLNAIPSVDGDPVIVSPGGSPRGLGFAGAHSDVQLALAPLDVGLVADYRARVHEAVAAAGRRPSDIAILFVLKPILVDSPEEADRLVAASAHPDDATLLRIAAEQSSDLETDLTGQDLDRPLDPSIFADHVSRGSIKGLLGKRGGFGEATLRELLGDKARLGRLSDRSGLVGTAEELADFIESFGEVGNDGFIFSGDLHPVTVHRMLDRLVPILRRRGILRREFGGRSLRSHLRDF